MSKDLPVKDKLHALYLIASFRPRYTVAIITFGFLTALLEGIGVTFIVPLVEVARSPGSPPTGGIVGTFASIYQFLGIPFSLGYIVAGLSVVLVVRYSATFLSAWARAYLRYDYVRDLQSRAFVNSLDARVSYFDVEGSDDILNAIVTQAAKAGDAIVGFIRSFQIGLLIIMYLSVALYLAPVLTFLAVGVVGLSTVVLRKGVESGYAVGDRVADANEKIQRAAQAGTQGIREVKMTGYSDKLQNDFSNSLAQFTDSSIKAKRNQALIQNVQNLAIAILIFVLIYISVVFTDMSFGALGAFLFVMFKAGPMVSGLNKRFYQLEGMLPHLLRTEEFIDDIKQNDEVENGDRRVPENPLPIVFDDVHFSYDENEEVLSGISFEIEKGEFVAFVGESGAGKSTIASLIARLYEHESGDIYANRTPIEEYDIDEWRSQIAYVRQDPFIFNTTLKRNILMANPEASHERLERVSEIAQVTEFLDELPDGYDTELGDSGARLSGGQKQRVALARALLEDASLLLLDEATSDLDTNIEDRVHTAIESMDEDISIIAIAHRLSTVRDADQIYTIDDGGILEKGEHSTLLEEDGRYAELYYAQ